MMPGFYYNPEKYGLETVGQIDWDDDDYQFCMTVVWQRVEDGKFLYGDDSGCSCPSPFEDVAINDLKEIVSLAEFQQMLEEQVRTRIQVARNAPAEVVNVLERMHQRGLR
jgi:hypothetical protein